MYQRLFTLQEEVFKVLANQKRLEIIQLLSGRELSVTQMIEMLGLPQANLSQHLSLLRQAKVVAPRRDGQTIYYHITDERISEACSMVKEMLKSTHKLERIDEVLYPIVKDVVCGMRMSVSQAGDSDEYAGTKYYFCASGCKETFHAHPQNFVKHKEIHRG